MWSVGWEGGLSPPTPTLKLAVQSLFQVYLLSPRYICTLFSPLFKTNATAPSRASQLLIIQNLTSGSMCEVPGNCYTPPTESTFLLDPPPPCTPLEIPFHWSYPSTHNFPNYNISFGTTRKEHLWLSFWTKLMIAFVRRQPILVFLWHKGRNFQAIMRD